MKCKLQRTKLGVIASGKVTGTTGNQTRMIGIARVAWLKITQNTLAGLSIALLFASAQAPAYVTQVSSIHYRVIRYAHTRTEAIAICDAFAQSHGYSGCNSGSNIDVYGGWYSEQKGVIKTPFYFIHVYHSNNCPAPLVFTEDEGCITKDESCPLFNPINLGTGNKRQTETDYTGSGPFPLKVSRTFNLIGNVTTPLWNFFPKLHVTSGASVVVVSQKGTKLRYTPNGSGSWTSDPDVTATLESIETDGVVTGWRYRTLDGKVEEFNNNGTLLSVTNRAGLSHTYVRTGSEIIVTHSNGNVLVYQIGSYINGFTTPDNEQYSYNNANGTLNSIIYPDGSNRSYHYTSHFYRNVLTGITDANGDRFATWTYAGGRATSSEHYGGAERGDIDYTHIDDAIDPRATATNALGKQTTYRFANINGARKIVRVEGHPTATCAGANKNYTYDANGFLASKTDWKDNTTIYSRNSKGQELSRTEAFGTSAARAIFTEWHPTLNLRTRLIEADRETIYTYDATGNLLGEQTIDLATP